MKPDDSYDDSYDDYDTYDSGDDMMKVMMMKMMNTNLLLHLYLQRTEYHPVISCEIKEPT